MKPGQPESDEIFDHELTRVLAVHGPELDQASRTLLATGTASIVRPGVILRVRLRAPRRWRRGLLEIIAAAPATGAVLGRSAGPLGRRGRDGMTLVQEITIDLGMELAHGHLSAGPQSGR